MSRRDSCPSAPAVPAHQHALRHTDRYVALLRDRAGQSGADVFRQAAGIRLIPSTDLETGVPPARVGPGEGMWFEHLGAALLRADPDQMRALERHAGTLVVRPERYGHARGDMSHSTGALADSNAAAWGLQATQVLSSGYSGRGVRLAILDTGLDLEHPDFAHRTIVAQSFVEGVSAGDANGHGTFCAGVACGPRRPREAPRYGIACDADLYVARVLDDNADGTDGNVIAAIDWAVRHRCAVISLSLGSPVSLGDSYPEVYERVAARALAAGCLLIAPAGNQSQRPDVIAPVEQPANCPSILAIGAVDQSLEPASFSNGGLNSDGGELGVMAPGIAILSAAPRPTLYQNGSGTSMAVPCVAGIAALLAEASPAARGAALRALLLESALPLSAPARDVGAGLVRAPQ